MWTAASAQDPSQGAAATAVDTTSPQLDWNPKTQSAWPEKRWNLDPWWNTAMRLVKAQTGKSTIRTSDNPLIPRTADTWNRRLLKALGLSVVQLGATEAHETGQGRYRFELIKAKFRGPVEFEIRQSIWVWVIWFPKSSVEALPGHDVLTLLPHQYASHWVPVDIDSSTTPPRIRRLSLPDLPPYLQDMLVMETAEGVCISGSKIMGAIATIPGHSVLTNRVWFGGQRHVQQASQ